MVKKKKLFTDKKAASAAGKKSRRGLSKKTILWKQLGNYIIEDGANKFLTEIKALKGKDYIDKYTMILEFFKPKIARTELVGDKGKELFPANKMTSEQIKKLINEKIKKLKK